MWTQGVCFVGEAPRSFRDRVGGGLLRTTMTPLILHPFPFLPGLLDRRLGCSLGWLRGHRAHHQGGSRVRVSTPSRWVCWKRALRVSGHARRPVEGVRRRPRRPPRRRRRRRRRRFLCSKGAVGVCAKGAAPMRRPRGHVHNDPRPHPQRLLRLASLRYHSQCPTPSITRFLPPRPFPQFSDVPGGFESFAVLPSGYAFWLVALLGGIDFHMARDYR